MGRSLIITYLLAITLLCTITTAQTTPEQPQQQTTQTQQETTTKTQQEDYTMLWILTLTTIILGISASIKLSKT